MIDWFDVIVKINFGAIILWCMISLIILNHINFEDGKFNRRIKFIIGGVVVLFSSTIILIIINAIG